MGSSFKSGPGGTTVPVFKIYQHPRFNVNVFLDFDFAILELSSPIVFNANQRPIQLPLGGAVVDDRATYFVSGWGATNSPVEPDSMLRRAIVLPTDQALCQSAYEPMIVSASMICAAAPGRDSCQGDSGGPLSSGSVLYGVVSWGNGCALKDYPGVYAQVSAAIPWISSIVR